MKLAVIGSRELKSIPLDNYIQEGTLSVIEYSKKISKPFEIIICK
jgi:hypothetical protein